MIPLQRKMNCPAPCPSAVHLCSFCKSGTGPSHLTAHKHAHVKELSSAPHISPHIMLPLVEYYCKLVSMTKYSSMKQNCAVVIHLYVIKSQNNYKQSVPLIPRIIMSHSSTLSQNW
jgi:hypothetical protein